MNITVENGSVFVDGQKSSLDEAKAALAEALSVRRPKVGDVFKAKTSGALYVFVCEDNKGMEILIIRDGVATPDTWNYRDVSFDCKLGSNKNRFGE